ncbi:MAG: chemotaxis protein CheW [Dissulfuribacterales bacterium]
MTDASSTIQDGTTQYTPLKVLVLLIAGRESAIELSQVKEILPAAHTEYLPNAVPSITGILNVRGDVIPIVDLKYFLSEEYQALDTSASNPKIVLVESECGPHGLMVNSVLRVEDGLWETHAPSDSLKYIQRENILFTKAITNSKGYSLPVIDIQKIIAHIARIKQDSTQT